VLPLMLLLHAATAAVAARQGVGASSHDPEVAPKRPHSKLQNLGQQRKPLQAAAVAAPLRRLLANPPPSCPAYDPEPKVIACMLLRLLCRKALTH
jgi:hypothetical protein